MIGFAFFWKIMPLVTKLSAIDNFYSHGTSDLKDRAYYDVANLDAKTAGRNCKWFPRLLATEWTVVKQFDCHRLSGIKDRVWIYGLLDEDKRPILNSSKPTAWLNDLQAANLQAIHWKSWSKAFGRRVKENWVFSLLTPWPSTFFWRISRPKLPI